MKDTHDRWMFRHMEVRDKNTHTLATYGTKKDTYCLISCKCSLAPRFCRNQSSEFCVFEVATLTIDQRVHLRLRPKRWWLSSTSWHNWCRTTKSNIPAGIVGRLKPCLYTRSGSSTAIAGAPPTSKVREKHRDSKVNDKNELPHLHSAYLLISSLSIGQRVELSLFLMSFDSQMSVSVHLCDVK